MLPRVSVNLRSGRCASTKMAVGALWANAFYNCFQKCLFGRCHIPDPGWCKIILRRDHPFTQHICICPTSIPVDLEIIKFLLSDIQYHPPQDAIPQHLSRVCQDYTENILRSYPASGTPPNSRLLWFHFTPNHLDRALRRGKIWTIPMFYFTAFLYNCFKK